MKSTVRCFGDPKDTIDSKQLKNQIYLLRFGHTSALLLKKKWHEMAIFPVLGKLTHMLVVSITSYLRGSHWRSDDWLTRQL